MASTHTVSPENLSAALKDVLDEYNGYIVDDMKVAAKAAADQANKEIKAHTTFRNRSGKYVRSFKVSKMKEGNSYVEYAWHAGQYRLTHLLERGHKTRSKGGGKLRADAFPHIEYGERVARLVFEKELTEAVTKHG